jgi:crossover junction endodeoxyribonuclease RuvC
LVILNILSPYLPLLSLTEIMLVLGIDPGCGSTGYALVEKVRGRYVLRGAGAIQSKASLAMEQRLAQIHEGLVAQIQVYQPDVVAIEAIFRHKSSESALKLGQARGVALLAAAQAKVPLFEYNAMTVKKSVTGSGRADKNQIERVVTMLLGHKVDGPHDAVDAVAIAITHHAHSHHHAAVGALR